MNSSTVTRRPDDIETAARDFARDGYVVLRGLVAAEVCEAVAADVRASLDPVLAPAEYEADVGYPGSPDSRTATGGDTPRRLLNAYSRFPALRAAVTGEPLASYLRGIMGTPDVLLSQCHHNCVMTKSPGYSSVTLWHQDIRYWRFQQPQLVSLWLALGEETEANGALKIIPGSHRMAFTHDRLDDAQFLKPELPENQALIATARNVELTRGDVLLFHCQAFHAAGRNTTERSKLSCVFTYHAAHNLPVPGTRSAQYPGIPLSQS
jgi:phytanoyl-CoA hydroxylase